MRRTRTTDFYDVSIREGMADVLPGYQTPVYGYEGIYPGPTIRARKGRRVVVTQHNRLAFDSNVHLHGGYVPAAHDGHPMDVIAPGSSFRYEYPNDQDAATLWYHDHAHGRTSRTLYYGLLAFYVLEDDLERELDLPAGDYDVPIVLADHAFNRDGSFRYQENVDVGFRGDTLIVNGVVSPRMRVERRRYRFRFLNASNGRTYTLRLGGGRRMVQIAGDGGLLERPVGRTRVPLHPAERADIVIDFPTTRRAPSSSCTTPTARAGRCRSCASTSRAAGSEDFRVPRRLRPREPLPAQQRVAPLGAGARRGGLGDQRARSSSRTASTSGRASAAPSAGPSSTAPTACTRCTSTASCSGSCPAAAAAWTRPTGSAGRTRSACCRTRRSPSSRGSRRTPGSTCSTATRSSTRTRR